MSSEVFLFIRSLAEAGGLVMGSHFSCCSHPKEASDLHTEALRDLHTEVRPADCCGESVSLC